MKIFLAIQAMLALVACQVSGARLGENSNKARHLTEGDFEDKVLFLSGTIGPNSEKPCVQAVPDSEWVHQADCSTNPPGTIWSTYGDGLLHNAIGGCLQAGYGAAPHDGTNMRVRTCDAFNPLQKFEFATIDSDGNPAGDLKLQSNSDLCVTFSNDSLILIMKECGVLSDTRRNWSLSYHVYDYLFNQDGAAESARGVHIEEADIYLGDSTNEHPAASWRMDESTGMIKNGYGECMQAGHGELIQDGSHVRVYPCDGSNDLQKFRIRDEVNDPPSVINGNGRFKLQNNDIFCITVANNPEMRILILKTCPDNDNQGGRWGWVLA